MREVIGGKTVFGPKSASDEGMNAFQILAEEIIELCENGYLTGCRPNRESRTGKRQIDLISVAGITAAGRRAVQASPNTTDLQRNDDQDTFCPKCNHSLRPAAKFCDDCGFSLGSINDPTLPMVQTSRPGPNDSFIGLVLYEKYQIISEIGKGGMGRVYRARHLRLSKDVAIKVIDKKFVSDADAVERFKREARTAASLRHPNIIAIFDIDETPEPDRRLYIVMELVDGKTLKTVLGEVGRLQIDRAIALIVEICKAVSFAHREGVIHRDIKPDNIMVMRRDGEAGECIKVLDFGLAKMRESEEPSITHVGTLMGTAFYMSPEQCRGEVLDVRSDVYSLATVLYEMMSGAPPFSGSNVMSVCAKHQSAPVPVLDASLGVPDGILRVLNTGLAKSREDRPSDAQHFSLQLQAAYGHFSDARTDAALAQTVEDQEITTEEIDAKPSEAAEVQRSKNSQIILVPIIESHRTSADNAGEIDYYAFRVSLRNESDKTIRNFRLEVEVPNAYADPTHEGSMSNEVRRVGQHSTRYRHTQDQFPGFVLYPNDVSPILMNTNYQMRFDQYENARGAIKVSVYVEDEVAGRAEYSISDNRNNDRMAQLGIEQQTGHSLTENQLQDIRSYYFRYGHARCPKDEAVLRVTELQSDEQVTPELIIVCPLCGLNERSKARTTQ